MLLNSYFMAPSKYLRCWTFIIMFFPYSLFAQKLIIKNSNNLILSGSSYLVLNNQSGSNTEFYNYKTFKGQDQSTVYLASSGPAFVGGTVAPTFRNISVDLNNPVNN